MATIGNLPLSDLHTKLATDLGIKFVGLKSPPLTVLIDGTLTEAEIIVIKGIVSRFNLYGSYDPDMIKDLTPAQLDTWIENNVTDLTSAKQALKIVGHALLFLLQRDIA